MLPHPIAAQLPTLNSADHRLGPAAGLAARRQDTVPSCYGPPRVLDSPGAGARISGDDQGRAAAAAALP